MKATILYIDNNVFDYFFKNNIGIKDCFNEDEFSLFITQHGEYEIKQIPDSKLNKKKYITNKLLKAVTVDRVFGFYSERVPLDEQRVSGFDQGRFTTIDENEMEAILYQEFGSQEKRKESQILFKEEADIELGARSTIGIVITFDKKKGKKSPLREAKNRGGRILFLDMKEATRLPVNEFINSLINQIHEIKIT